MYYAALLRHKYGKRDILPHLWHACLMRYEPSAACGGCLQGSLLELSESVGSFYLKLKRNSIGRHRTSASTDASANTQLPASVITGIELKDLLLAMCLSNSKAEL